MNIHLTGRMRLPLTAVSALILTAGILAATATSASASNVYPIVNENSGLCLGINGGGNDQPAVQWGCNSHPDQHWHWGSQNSYYPGWKQLVNGNGSCLGVAAGSGTEGARVVGWSCLGSGHYDQYWLQDLALAEDYPCDPGYVPYLNLNSRYVLGVAGNSRAGGAAVVQWGFQGSCSGGANQYWDFPVGEQ